MLWLVSCAIFTVMIRSLRFITDGPCTARFNMAADLYLMERCSAEETLFVRLYSWGPPAVTIGSLQRAEKQLDMPTLFRDKVDWIRRPTGGRAVLHNDDITYSCIFPANMVAMGRSVADTYGKISICLMAALRLVGITAQLQQSASPLIKSGRDVRLPCFLAPNRNEIMVQRRKLVGSAQYRSASAVLQHGSLPFGTAYRRLPYYLPLSEEERSVQYRLLEKKSICLREIAPLLSREELCASFAQGFREELSPAEWYEEGWSESEYAQIDEVIKSERFGRCLRDDP